MFPSLLASMGAIKVLVLVLAGLMPGSASGGHAHSHGHSHSHGHAHDGADGAGSDAADMSFYKIGAMLSIVAVIHLPRAPLPSSSRDCIHAT